MPEKYKNNIRLMLWLRLVHRLAYFLFNSGTYFQKNRRKLSYLTRQLLPTLNKNYVCPTIYDFKLCLNENGGHWVYYLGFYEMGTLDLMRKCLNKGDVVFDVGSSIGLMTLTASKIVGEEGTVFSFEPDRSRFENLENSIAINNCKNIKPYNFAVGSSETDVFLNSNLPTPMISETISGRMIRVKSKTIDSIIVQENIFKVAFIKIDVEGYELEVLKGAKQLLTGANAPIICVECNTLLKTVDTLTVSSVLEFIKECNPDYIFYQLSKTSHVISKLKVINCFEELNTTDNLYCFLPIHKTLANMGRTFGEIDDRSFTLFASSINYK